MKYAHQVPDRPEQINLLWSDTLAVMDKVISKPLIFYYTKHTHTVISTKGLCKLTTNHTSIIIKPQNMGL